MKVALDTRRAARYATCRQPSGDGRVFAVGGFPMRRALVLLVMVSAGCQSARVVSRTADDGIVALPANTNEWPNYHQDAGKKIIAAHLGANYEVVEEKEVTTGYATTNVQDRQFEPTMNTTNPFLPASRETTTTKTVNTPQKEWQIHYRRVMPRPATAMGANPPATVVTTAYVSGQPAGGPAAGPELLPPPVTSAMTP